MVVPVYNEVDSVSELVDRVAAAAAGVGRAYEIVLVDDGSSDGTAARLKALHGDRQDTTIVTFRRNYGQARLPRVP